MNQLSRMLYLSTATEPQTEETLRNILEQSRVNNLRDDITGVLCAGGGHYIQVLEGGEHDILRLYLKIAADPRHKDCVLIGITPVPDRLLKGWSMGFIEKSTHAMTERRAELLAYRQHQEAGVELVKLMQRFLEMLRAKD